GSFIRESFPAPDRPGTMTNRIGSTGTASLIVASAADGAARATRLGLAHLAPKRVYRPIHRGGEGGGGLLAAEATGAGHHGQGGGAPVLLLGEDGPGLDHRREQRLQLGQLAGDLVLVGARDGHPAGADDHLHGTPRQRFLDCRRRWCDGRMPSSSRYLATVRRAMVSPCPCSAWAISWSERAAATSPASTISLIICFTDTDDTIDPLTDTMPLWKKYLSSNRPCGVCTYLFVV